MSVRFSEEERARLFAAAGDMPVSAYIKSKLFADGMPPARRRIRASVKDERALAEVLACLGASRIPNNLNQLARAANSGSLMMDWEVKAHIAGACNDIRVMRQLHAGARAEGAGRTPCRAIDRAKLPAGRRCGSRAMILKGSQRAGAGRLAAHLLNERDNDHITVHELRGFAADDLHGALTEAQAVARGTKCKQFLFSLSLNPPKDAQAGEEDFERAAEAAERALGLDGQPRAIVIHEKEGRRHAHVVWSRIDAANMRAVNMAHYKHKLTTLSRALYLQHGWTLPEGLRAGGARSPLNFTLEEWQRAKRTGADPREIKATFREALAQSDSLPALRGALEERGYFLARGDRRGLVAVDLDGAVHALARWAGVKTCDLRERIGDGSDCPSVDAVRQDIARRVTGQMRAFIGDLRDRHRGETRAAQERLAELRARQRGERETLAAGQAKRWAAETESRAARLRAGLAGLWDRLTGKRAALERENEAETIASLARDRAQRDRLSAAHLNDRQPLQRHFERLRARHAQERRLLARQVAQRLRTSRRTHDRPRPDREAPERRIPRRGPSLDL